MQRFNHAFPTRVDCLILGGGITGAGVARDAAMRGLSTLLVESGDFASGTSHVTSKLIHGGLRYLFHGHFRLVLEGILERERLLTSIAPHLVRPLRFLVTFPCSQLPRWIVGAAAANLYGFLRWFHQGERSGHQGAGRLRRQYPLLEEPGLGFTFWDAQADDARLVLSTLRSAACLGATLCNYTQAESPMRTSDGWSVRLCGPGGMLPRVVETRVLVNATGPWSALTSRWLGSQTTPTMWIKGSHILMRRPIDFGDDAVVLRSLRDGRFMWAVPWETRIMVGSTESQYEGDLRDVHPTADEVNDLFESFRAGFPRAKMTREDIRCAYAGVRPIVHQETSCENSLSRRRQIDVDSKERLVTVSGGKLTTFRGMAEEAVDRVSELLGRPRAPRELRRRLRSVPLWPGLSAQEVHGLTKHAAAQAAQAGVGRSTLDHLIRRYGTDALGILQEGMDQPDQFRPLDAELPFCLGELKYLTRTECVRHLTDLVKRRTAMYFLSDEFGEPMLDRIARTVSPLLGWDERRQQREVDSTLEEYEADQAAVDPTTSSLHSRKRRAACA